MAARIQTVEWLNQRIDELEEDYKRSEAQNEALGSKIESLCKSVNTCGCSYDNQSDICAWHSPHLTIANERVLELTKQLSDIETVINRHSPPNYCWDENKLVVRTTLLQMLEYLLDRKQPGHFTT